MRLSQEQAIDKLGIVCKRSVVKEVKATGEKVMAWGSSLQYSGRREQEIIPCKMFVKEKFTANGAFDKIKSRLVAGGYRLDASLYKDKTSVPLVSTCVFATV